MELKTSKLNKVGSKHNVCTTPPLSTKPRKWLTQSSISVIFILQNHKSFSCVHTSNLISGFLSNIDYVSLKIKKLEISSLVSKFGKPPKPSKIKFVTKPPLKNQHRYRVHSCEMYFRTLFFYYYQRAKLWSIYVWTHQKPW